MASPVRFAIVRKQLEAAGWELVRISGAHHIFDRPGGPLVSIPVHHNQVKPFYAKQVQRIIAADKGANRDKPQAGEGEEPQGE
ncbi:MAG TPA: type II toxin-antitoxin system HicA family toxin [Pirellulaceae bacterium]|jgi:predicted RNA binding protein YcfA (HicA-like mRNA interferase family)